LRQSQKPYFHTFFPYFWYQKNNFYCICLFTTLVSYIICYWWYISQVGASDLKNISPNTWKSSKPRIWLRTKRVIFSIWLCIFMWLEFIIFCDMLPSKVHIEVILSIVKVGIRLNFFLYQNFNVKKRGKMAVVTNPIGSRLAFDMTE